VRLVIGVLPRMSGRGRGPLVNICSVGVLFGAPRFSAYLASKSACESLLRCIAPEVRGQGGTVTNTYMPLVHTPMAKKTHMDRILPGLTAEEAAARICSAVVERPRRVAPTLGLVGRLFADAAPAPFDGLTYRWSTHPSAARGKSIDALEAPLLAQQVLRRLDRRSSRARG
jgi:short-subunit dehydrogenase